MSLTTLPIEVLEHIFLYVDVESLLNAWNAVGMDGCNSFWEKKCKRECFEKADNEKDSCWRTVFQRNLNWITRTFIKREYNVSLIHASALGFDPLLFSPFIQGENLLLRNYSNESLSVWNIDDSPKLAQTLKCWYPLVPKGSKLVLTDIASGLVYTNNVYSFENNMYKQLLSSDVHFPDTDIVYDKNILSDKFLAYGTKENNIHCIKAVNLTSFEEFSLPLELEKVLSLSLYDYLLNIMLQDENRIILRRNDLSSKKWLNDLVLFEDTAIISSPELQVSSDLIISWGHLVESREITPLKIWNTDGEPITSALNLNPLHSLEKILWMVVESQYVILSYLSTSITIWNAKYPNEFKDLPKSDKHYNGQKVISGSLLVLAYTKGFKVIDITKAVYLYGVRFDDTLDIHWIGTLFLVNENFFVRFHLRSKNKDFTGTNSTVVPKQSLSPDGRLPSGTQCDSNLNLEKDKQLYFCIYDFRVKN